MCVCVRVCGARLRACVLDRVQWGLGWHEQSGHPQTNHLECNRIDACEYHSPPVHLDRQSFENTKKWLEDVRNGQSHPHAHVFVNIYIIYTHT